MIVMTSRGCYGLEKTAASRVHSAASHNGLWQKGLFDSGDYLSPSEDGVWGGLLVLLNLVGGARLPLMTLIWAAAFSMSSIFSGLHMETLAEGGTVVVPVGPAVELKHDLDVLDMLTPVETSLASLWPSMRESATWIISGWLLGMRLSPGLTPWSPRAWWSLLFWPPCSLAWASSLLRMAFLSWWWPLARPRSVLLRGNNECST